MAIERRGWFTSVFDHAPVGIAVVGADSRIIEANGALAEMLDTAADELRGTVFTDHSHPDDQHLDSALFAEVAAGTRGAYSAERRYRSAAGLTRWGRVCAWRVPSDNGGRDVVIGMVEDVTEAREAQDRLHAQAELARIGEMASVVAHEFKNPLAGISGALQIIRDRLFGRDAEMAIIDEIQSRIGALDDTVNDLLDFSRPVAPPASSVSIREVVDECAAAAAGARVDVLGGDGMVVRGDRGSLHRVFRSLFCNAVDAGGGRARVRVTLSADDEGMCDVEVADDGPGLAIDPERIFEPFVTTKSHGTGLDLAIARRIVEAHHGTIDAHSGADGGATFRLRLPLDTESTA